MTKTYTGLIVEDGTFLQHWRQSFTTYTNVNPWTTDEPPVRRDLVHREFGMRGVWVDPKWTEAQIIAGLLRVIEGGGHG